VIDDGLPDTRATRPREFRYAISVSSCTSIFRPETLCRVYYDLHLFIFHQRTNIDHHLDVRLRLRADHDIHKQSVSSWDCTQRWPVVSLEYASLVRQQLTYTIPTISIQHVPMSHENPNEPAMASARCLLTIYVGEFLSGGTG